MSAMAADSRPTVSVIIPTYNRAHMVGAAIDSLLAQTRRPTQIIVVDDGSTDDTSSVLKRYAGQITAISQENRGRSAARNVGLKHAHADYIAFLDSDDTLPPDSIEFRARMLDQDSSVDVVYGDALVQNADTGQEIAFSRLHCEARPDGNVLASLALGNIAPIHCFMFRTSCLSFVDGFDESLETLEDHDFWLRLATSAQFGYVNVPVATYVVHPGMTTHTMPNEMRRGRLIVQERVTASPAFETFTPTQKSRVFTSLGATSLALGRTREARQWLGKSLKEVPALQPMLLYLLTFFSPGLAKSILGLRRMLRAILDPKTRMFYA